MIGLIIFAGILQFGLIAMRIANRMKGKAR